MRAKRVGAKIDYNKRAIPSDYVYGEGKYCDFCYSQNIEYGRFYRICKDCGRSINTSKVIWG